MPRLSCPRRNMKNQKPPENEIHAFKVEISKWSNSSCSKDLARVYAADRVALRKVLALFRAGKMLEAGQAAYSLDTLVRDVIPGAAWRRMTDFRTEDRKAAGPY